VVPELQNRHGGGRELRSHAVEERGGRRVVLGARMGWRTGCCEHEGEFRDRRIMTDEQDRPEGRRYVADHVEQHRGRAFVYPVIKADGHGAGQADLG